MPNRAVRLLAVGAVVLAACVTSSPSPTGSSGTPETPTIVPFVSAVAVTGTPPAPSASPTSTPGPAWLGTGCDPNEIVAALRPTITYPESSLSHNYLMSVYYLNVWIVDTSLDPVAEEAALDPGVILAKRHAAVLGHQLNRGDACLGRVFDQIVVTVVDRDYNTWFSGSIAPLDLPDSDSPSDAEVDRAVEAFAPGFVRSEPTASVGRAGPPSESCSWAEARTLMEERLGAGHPNAAFTYAVDNSGANVWGQWDGPTDVDVFLPVVTEIGLELACLYPAPDTFWVVYTDAYGGTQLIVAEPGEAIRQGDLQTMVDQLEIVYPQAGQ